jgi:hypothetical protein
MVSRGLIPKRRRDARKGYWHEGFVCWVVRVAYDFRTHSGEAWFPPEHCCDGTGCVAFFEAVDAEVALIRTYAGDRPDTVYRKYVGDAPGWMALPPPRGLTHDDDNDNGTPAAPLPSPQKKRRRPAERSE